VAASAFRQEIDHAIQRIIESPERFPNTTTGARRFVMMRFPFSIVYSLTEAEIIVVAIAHQRRRPDYWLAPRRI
jgi:plasmid stabilization system protein ParE